MTISLHRCHALYCMAVAVFATSLFLCGFFPVKRHSGIIATVGDLPSYIEDISVNASSMYTPVIGRLVFMVIDALRFDFIAGLEGQLNMPYTTSLIKNEEACLLTGKANPPTVTMPRIKALTTGTVPNFINIALNFGGSQIREDNWIVQAEHHGMDIVFYGDDTWLKLFPDSFRRKDGTTSFFVSDFKEVDDNVTRHLKKELQAVDWKIMILHYLGLDHIGHIEGPKGSHIRPKLQEMDSIIQNIHLSLTDWSKSSSEAPLLIVCGDHGMKDSGGHGGASLTEMLVPLITVGHKCSPHSISWGEDDAEKLVPQIDLVPTLSLFLGLPIPTDNLGKLIPSLLSRYPVKAQLYALHYNAKQVAAQYKKAGIHGSQGSYLQYREAVRLHVDWLRSDEPAYDASDRVAALYMLALSGMSSALEDSLVTYDLYTMAVATWILWQTCIILLLTVPSMANTPSNSYIITRLFLLSLLHLSLSVMYCSFGDGHSMLCSFTPITTSVLLTTIAVTACNTYFIMYSYAVGCIELVSWHALQCLLILGSALHILSLASSSFIEEEHQVWYFLWTTYALITLYNLVRATVTAGGKKGNLAWHYCGILIIHQLLRKLNQTGDKWASLPDVGDWLAQPECKTYLSVTLLLGLVGVIWSCYHLSSKCSFLRKTALLIDTILYVMAAVSIYCYRTATGSALLPFVYPQSRGIGEAYTFWCIIVAVLCKSFIWILYRTLWMHQDNEQNHILGQLLTTVTSCLLLVCALLHRPYNVLLLGTQVWTSVSICAMYRLAGRGTHTAELVIVHIWLGLTFFFYQGNSNSLASVDVAAGYVGQDKYDPVTVGTLLIVNTYTAPILSYILLVIELTQHLTEEPVDWFCKQLGTLYQTMACMRLLPLAVYMLLITFQRYHLFVWTVFSPKLLYEAMHTTVVFVLLLVTDVVIRALARMYHPSIKLKE